MEFTPFSKKQLLVLTWWCFGSKHSKKDALICDGAVRSGKTLCMSISFVLWAFWAFNGHSFAICGKTVTSLKRNIIVPLCQQLTELARQNNINSENLIHLTIQGGIDINVCVDYLKKETQKINNAVLQQKRSQGR